MRAWRWTLTVAALLVMLAQAQSSSAIGLGVPAPNFTKPVLGGGSTSLSNYAGKVVIIHLLGYG